jgi:hypothetical protein
MSTLHIVNPENRSMGRYSRSNRYVLWFGAHGPTYLMVWEDSLEDALETAAGWLADNAPGLIMPDGDEHLESLRREACEEHGLTYPAPDGTDYEAEGYYAAFESAEADLTYTESGYLTSYEWGIMFDEHHSRAELKQWLAELAERHYSDKPLITVG